MATPAVDVIGALADLSAATPAAEVTLAAALDAMEPATSGRLLTMRAAVEHAERLAVELGHLDLLMRARLLRADILSIEGDAAESGRISHEVHAWVTEHGHPYLLARSHRQMALFFFHVGALADALAHAVQSVAHMPEDAAPAVRAKHLTTLGVMFGWNGSVDEAHRRHKEALDIAVAVGDASLSMQLLNNMAYEAWRAGQLGEAEDLVEQMRAQRERFGLAFAAHELDTIARVELSKGRYTEVEATLRPILDGTAAHLLDGRTVLADCMLTVAQAQRLRGDLAAAQRTLDRVVAVCEERILAAVRAQAREEQAQLYAATGRYRQAYEEHRRFHLDSQALQSAQKEARARILQAVFEAEEARRESVRFREMAHRDALTGLHNRRFVDEQFPALLALAAEHGTPMSVAVIDLDHFKRINDTLSHATGDAVLRQLATLLTQAVIDGVAARLGGEEFLLILPGTDAETAIHRCEQLRRTIRDHDWRPFTGGISVTASIGVTTAVEGLSTTSTLLANADRNLYAAKRSGRNRVVGDPC